jgi:fatty-acid desaturase
MGLFFTVFAVSYLYHGLGITLGYHRLLSHRSFKVPVWFEYLLVSGAYLSLEGAPIFWVTTHRLHHRYSDHQGDPHSPKDGFWHAFLGWMSKPLVKITDEDHRTVCPDLFRDPLYRFLHFDGKVQDGLMCLFSAIVFRLVIFLLLGPYALAGSLAGTALAFVSPLMVNSFCHIQRYGYRTFPIADQSRNVWFVALTSLGEGWHNNHHALPQSARHGMKAWEFDFSWIVIQLLAVLGIVRDIKLPNAAALARASQGKDETEVAVATK